MLIAFSLVLNHYYTVQEDRIQVSAFPIRATYSNKFPKKGVVKAEKEEDTFFQVKT
jgi:hypothetical protein